MHRLKRLEALEARPRVPQVTPAMLHNAAAAVAACQVEWLAGGRCWGRTPTWMARWVQPVPASGAELDALCEALNAARVTPAQVVDSLTDDEAVYAVAAALCGPVVMPGWAGVGRFHVLHRGFYNDALAARFNRIADPDAAQRALDALLRVNTIEVNTRPGNNCNS